MHRISQLHPAALPLSRAGLLQSRDDMEIRSPDPSQRSASAYEIPATPKSSFVLLTRKEQLASKSATCQLRFLHLRSPYLTVLGAPVLTMETIPPVSLEFPVRRSFYLTQFVSDSKLKKVLTNSFKTVLAKARVEATEGRWTPNGALHPIALRNEDIMSENEAASFCAGIKHIYDQFGVIQMRRYYRGSVLIAEIDLDHTGCMLGGTWNDDEDEQEEPMPEAAAASPPSANSSASTAPTAATPATELAVAPALIQAPAQVAVAAPLQVSAPTPVAAIAAATDTVANEHADPQHINMPVTNPVMAKLAEHVSKAFDGNPSRDPGLPLVVDGSHIQNQEQRWAREERLIEDAVELRWFQDQELPLLDQEQGHLPQLHDPGQPLWAGAPFQQHWAGTAFQQHWAHPAPQQHWPFVSYQQHSAHQAPQQHWAYQAQQQHWPFVPYQHHPGPEQPTWSHQPQLPGPHDGYDQRHKGVHKAQQARKAKRGKRYSDKHRRGGRVQAQPEALNQAQAPDQANGQAETQVIVQPPAPASNPPTLP